MPAPPTGPPPAQPPMPPGPAPTHTLLLQHVPLPPDPVKPKAQLKPSRRGIENAKKMLRAFSIQKKQTLTPAIIAPMPSTSGGAAKEVVIGKLGGPTCKIAVIHEGDVAGKTVKVEKTAKPPKPGHKKRDSNMNLKMTKSMTEIENMKRKLELVELGVPLALLQPLNNPISKGLPTKAMPVIKAFLVPRWHGIKASTKEAMRPPKRTHSTQDRRNPKDLDEFLRKAKKAKASGKELKFDYKKLLPRHVNPFETANKKEAGLKSNSRDYWDRKRSLERMNVYSERHKSRKDKYERNDIGKSEDNRDDEVRYGTPKDKETEVNLSDYFVCDSWSLDTEDKVEDSTPTPESKPEQGKDEKTKAQESMETVSEKLIELPKDKIRPVVDTVIDTDDDVSSEHAIYRKGDDSALIITTEIDRGDEQSKILTTSERSSHSERRKCSSDISREKKRKKKKSKNRIENYSPSPSRSEKQIELPKDKIRPVVDTLIDFDDDVSSEQGIYRKEDDQTVFIKTEIDKVDERSELLMASEQTNYSERRKFSSDVSREKKSKEMKSKNRLVNYSPSPSRSELCKILVHHTPERQTSNDLPIRTSPKITNYTNDYEKSPELPAGNEPSLMVDCEPLTPDHRVKCTPEQEDARPCQEYQDPPKMSQALEECLDMWNFVLKICQPLLFRHDNNNCYRKTKDPPSVWFTENPKMCDCVMDRVIVYEELDTLKMTLVDKVYASDQIQEQITPPIREWYPKDQLFLSEQPSTQQTIPTSWETDESQNSELMNFRRDQTSHLDKNTTHKASKKPPLSTSPGEHRNSLDREYEKFMEAVWPEVDVIKKVLKSPGAEKFQKSEEKKNKRSDVTSELGTSMDETVVSTDELSEGKKKDRKKEKKLSKASSEYWSQESAAENETDKGEAKNTEKTIKKKKTKGTVKKSLKKRSRASSSDRDSSSGSSVEHVKEKRKEVRNKMSRASKLKLARKRRLEKKKRLREKQKRRLKKLKEKEKSLAEGAVESGLATEKEKSKKKDEAKPKDKRKKTEKIKRDAKKRKPKAALSSSSSSSTTSSSSESSSSSSSQSEDEKTKRRNKAKNKLKEAKKKKAKKAKRRQSTSDSYSDVEEAFDMNILNNIKMEPTSDEERVSKLPQRLRFNQEIISVSELHSDFVGNNYAQAMIKQEKMDVSEDKEIPEERQDEINEEKAPDKTSECLELQEDSISKLSADKVSLKSGDDSVSQDSSNFGRFKGSIDSNSETQLTKQTPEDSITSPISQDSNFSFRDKPIYEKDDSFPRPSSQNSNYSFRDVITSSQSDSGYMQRAPQEECPPEEPGYLKEEKQPLEEYGEHFAGPYEAFDRREESVSKEYELYDAQDRGYMVYEGHYMEHLESQENAPLPASQPEGCHAPACTDARPIETVISATGTRGEIKCDWRPRPRPHEAVGSAAAAATATATKRSRWGMQSKPGEANIVLTSPEGEVYPIRSVLDRGEPPQTRLYRIETISSSRARDENGSPAGGYDDAYADMYGESDRLQYGDCFAAPEAAPAPAPAPAPAQPRARAPAPAPADRSRLSLDDRINLVLEASNFLGQKTKNGTPEEQPTDGGILINRLSPSGRELGGREVREVRGVRAARAGKRVTFADGYNPGQDSDTEEPPPKKKKWRRRYGCAWPCPASHPDHAPLWDALPPPPPPPGSPPPPRAPAPPPAQLLRRKRPRPRDELPEPPEPLHASRPKYERSCSGVSMPQPAPTITRLPKGLGHPDT